MGYIFDMNKELLEKIASQQKELEALQKASQISVIDNTDQNQTLSVIDNTENETATTETQKERGFEEETKKYLELLELISIDDDIDNEVLEVLPQDDEYDKERLVKRLYIEYCNKIRQTMSFIGSEKKNGTNDEELLPFYEEVEKYEKIKDSLKRSVHLDQKIEPENIEENNLLFLTTNSGRIRVFEAIDDIDSRCYPALNELFTSIIDGTFKGGKTFTGNNRVEGISEVRNLEYQLRVIYAPIAPKYYAVLGVIIKKTDTNSHYKQLLISMVNNLNSQKKSLENGLNNPEFCQQQEEYTQMLFNKLNCSKKQDQGTTDAKGTTGAKIKVKTTTNS